MGTGDGFVAEGLGRRISLAFIVAAFSFQIFVVPGCDIGLMVIYFPANFKPLVAKDFPHSGLTRYRASVSLAALFLGNLVMMRQDLL
jgi:hypothetical protein